MPRERREQSKLGDSSWVLGQPKPGAVSQEKQNHSGEEAAMELPTLSPRRFPGERVCVYGGLWAGWGKEKGDRHQRLSPWRVEAGAAPQMWKRTLEF